jgi:hypothetical protein
MTERTVVGFGLPGNGPGQGWDGCCVAPRVSG